MTITVLSASPVSGTGQMAVWKPSSDPDTRTALEAIKPNVLKGHVSFLASDRLGGRGTPSAGLDIAAEYIVSQFRSFGLEPVSKDGYLQEAPWPPTGEEKQKVYNVLGMIKGSDPLLRDTAVVVTAHYDHLGTRGEGEGDTIFNGANDNGSGTAGVLEIARVFSLMRAKPRRTVIFALWFGEEKGLQGSRYYTKHPLWPLAKTVAVVNLEQIGRIDDVEGPRRMAMAMTGYDYSDMGAAMRESARALKVEVQKHSVHSDTYFPASDNAVFANLGIPAHTLCTSFKYEDYHKPGDHWEKMDYDNMAAVVKAVALGVHTLASSVQVPVWNANNPKAAKYLEAAKAR